MISQKELRLREQLANRIRHTRNKRKMTQAQLGLKSSIHDNHIAQLESGERLPSLFTFYKLCLGLNCSPNHLLGFNNGKRT